MRGSVSLSSEPPYQEQLETKIEDLRQQVAELTLSSDTYFTERNSARDAWRRVSKERDQLRQQLTDLKSELKTIGKAIDDPRTDLTMTMSEVIIDKNQQLAAAQDDANTAWAQAHRLALELECLLLDTKDNAIVSKWWDSGMEALSEYQQLKPGAKEEAEAWAAMRKAGI